MVLKDHTSREKLVKLDPKLKNLQEPFKNIYISRDSHPVYLAENRYMRNLFKELRKKPPNGVNSEEITFHNGIIKVKDIEHARNMFLK